MSTHDKKWLKLDNAAKIYPATKSKRWTALFRMSCELKENVDPEVLNRALLATVKRFPCYTVSLKRGLFWYYLYPIEKEPVLQKDVANPCVRMDLSENDGFMFRVRYYNRRIAVEFFHALTDGGGGMTFLKTLIAVYLQLKYNIKIPPADDILDINEKPLPEEIEDSYIRYSRKISASRQESHSYRIRGTLLPPHMMYITSGYISAKQIIAKAKEYKVSLTDFLAANLVMAVYDISKNDKNIRRRNKPVKVCVPINMRQFYNSKTLRNFAMYVNPGIEPAYGEYTFEETLAAVHHFLRLEITEKKLNAKMSTNVTTEQNKLMRAVPLFLKKPAMKLVFSVVGDKQSSTIISNMGAVTVPDEMKPYIERLDVVLGSLKFNRVTCACVSFEDILAINFSRAIKESTLERNFFTRLVKMGIHVKIQSNLGE